MKISMKRSYDPVSPSDGTRVLVDRLWPRGVQKQTLHLDLWLKDVAPSSELRKWFSHEPEKWDQFQERYFHELDTNKAALEPLLKIIQKSDVTLIYSTKDAEHNNAVCLKKYIEKLLKHTH